LSDVAADQTLVLPSSSLDDPVVKKAVEILQGVDAGQKKAA